ncbi:MAG: Acetyl-coenzyme A synthetase [Acidimicrobiales bacterium]|nr:Acetyl-coenzyme A synthetase [Acidimicrobiales bacterium]
MSNETGVVWRAAPPDAAETITSRFMNEVGVSSYEALVKRSIEEPEWFWDAVVRFLGIPFMTPYTRVLDDSAGPEWCRWFDDGMINLSAVCVDRWAEARPSQPAVVAESESGSVSSLSYLELRDEVARAGGMLSSLGVARGDTIGVFLPMGVEAVVAMLAIARIGAIYVPIFSGYGAHAVASRLIDAEARLLVTADGFRRRGRLVDMKAVADEAAEMAGTVKTMVVVANDDGAQPVLRAGRDVWWDREIANARPVPPEPTGAEEPVLLAYTSGTTGRPKGVVHVHGGLTVKLAQEAAFQTDVRPGDRLMWVTDMGWIMGPWMVVGGLANGAGIVVYDGAPDHPDPGRLWEIVERHAVTQLGVSPTLVRALQARGDAYLAGQRLPSLRCFGSTGEPWNPDPWWWLFDRVGARRVPIVNLSGGTEVGACFLSVNLLQGLKPVSLGGPSLGMAVDVFDSGGQPVRGQVGELVCTKPWPGMTRGVWGDPARYLETYWSRYPGVWVHGDWASIDEEGFWFLHGRSDDTLNVAGKRLGPAEVESVAVGHPDIVMAAAVGIPHEVKGEVLAIYCVPRPGAERGTLAQAVADAVVAEFGKAFRPHSVLLVEDLPRTRSAKIVRRAVRARATGEDPGDVSSLENPECLELIEELG